MGSIKERDNVPVITPEAIQLPAGGASVRVGEGVQIISGLDHGDVAGRGFIPSVEGCSPKIKAIPNNNTSWAYYVAVMNA